MRTEFALPALFLLLSPGVSHAQGLSPERASSAQIVLEKRLTPVDSPDGKGFREVIIREGDSISSIMLSDGVPQAELDDVLRHVLDLNPGLETPDRIYPGQRIRLPARGTTLEGTQGVAESAPDGDPDGALSLASLRGSKELLPLLQQSFRELEETLTAEGTLSLPLSPGGVLTLNNERYPLLNLSTGRGLVLDLDNELSQEESRLIESSWSHYRVISLPGGSDLRQLMDLILESGGYYYVSRQEPITIGKNGLVSIVPDFLLAKEPESMLEGSIYLVTIESSASHSLPEHIKQMARERLITVVEIYPGMKGKDGPLASGPISKLKERKYTASDYRTLLVELGPSIGLTVMPEGSSLPEYGESSRLGFDSKAYLFLESGERSSLVTFGPFDPELPGELERKGIGFLPVIEDDTFNSVFGRLLHQFGLDYSGPQVEFYQPDGRYALSIPGFYLEYEDRKLLLTGEVLGPQLHSLLVSRGIKILTCLLP